MNRSPYLGQSDLLYRVRYGPPIGSSHDRRSDVQVLADELRAMRAEMRDLETRIMTQVRSDLDHRDRDIVAYLSRSSSS